MIKKMMRTTVAAAGFAALLLSGACAHNDAVTETDNTVVEVRPEDPSATGVQPGPALADSDGNVYSSSAAPGRGNAASVGTNTNVNHIAGTSSVEVRETTTDTTTDTMTSNSSVDTDLDLDTARDTTADTTLTTTTTTRTETVDVPMTSAAQEDTTATTTTTTRKRLRKD